MWALWVLGGLVGWTLLASVVAVVVGKAIRLGDERSPGTGVSRPLTSADIPGLVTSAAAPADLPRVVPRQKRRRVPLPPVGVALAGLGVALEFVGFLLRLSGAHGATARLLSMDAPLSVPRMYVTVLFAAAAVAAISGAGRIPGRRPWWAAVGVVAAAICFVKAGGTLHSAAMHWLDERIGTAGALLVSAAVVAAVVGLLWYLARKERRDRLRVLGSLALYAVAAVGFSAISASASGARFAAAATFVEESSEALGAVVFLMAVLVGVAPRLVLPADWALRRTADAETLDAANPARPGWQARGR